MLARALEHQVLEKVREAGFSGRLVGGADLYQIIWVTTGVR